jgi:hypothetical protein
MHARRARTRSSAFAADAGPHGVAHAAAPVLFLRALEALARGAKGLVAHHEVTRVGSAEPDSVFALFARPGWPALPPEEVPALPAIPAPACPAPPVPAPPVPAPPVAEPPAAPAPPRPAPPSAPATPAAPLAPLPPRPDCSESLEDSPQPSATTRPRPKSPRIPRSYNEGGPYGTSLSCASAPGATRRATNFANRARA